MNYIKILSAALSIAVCSACTQKESYSESEGSALVASTLSPETETRTVVTGDTSDGGIFTEWSSDDELGVFDKYGRHLRFIRKGSSSNSNPKFYPERGYYTPQYAYYPYRSINSGREPSDCIGNMPEVQEMASGKLHGDYKVGTMDKTNFLGLSYTMNFQHIITMIRITIDTDGTVLADDLLKTLKFSAKRNGEDVMISGDFHFSAVDGSIDTSYLGTTPSITLDWKDGVSLSAPVKHYFCMLPCIKAGDILRFEITTENHIAVIETPAKKDFEVNKVYDFPLTLTNFSDRLTIDGASTTEPEPEPEPEPTPEPEPEPTVTSGSFKAAAFNVDGLPKKISIFTINGNGPGADGTTAMAGIANRLGWDIIAASEDFEYHSQLAAALSDYNAGTYRGSISSAQLSSRADTDGLCFFWKKGLNVSSEGKTPASGAWEKMVQYNDEEGGLTSGANTCIKKGFRHYEVELSEGVVIDVYITHMNTYSGSGNTESNAYVAAVLGQLRQLRDYVLEKAAANRRPALIMGDTNMRYTRHDIRKNLLDYVASWTDANGLSGYSISDPWVEKYRGGVYPQWDALSLMTRFAFAGDTTNDIVCADNQRGEVVDKIWYLNVPGAEVQLSVLSHCNDVDNFRKSTSNVSYSGVMVEDENGTNTSGNTKYNSGQTVSYTKDVGYSDHFPVVTEFQWTRTVK